MSEERNTGEEFTTGGSTNPINRRKFIRAAGAGLVGTAGVSQTVAAKQQSSTDGLDESEYERIAKTAIQDYNTPPKFRDGFRKNEGGLMNIIADRGHFIDSDIDDLTSNLLTVSEYSEADEGAMVIGSAPEGEPLAMLHLKKQLGIGEIVAVVKPQWNKSYAILKANNQVDSSLNINEKIFDPDVDGNEFEV